MTHFQRWVPDAYMNSMAYLRRPASRPGDVLPWLLAVVASVTLTAVLLTHVVGGPIRAVSRGKPEASALMRLGLMRHKLQPHSESELAGCRQPGSDRARF